MAAVVKSSAVRAKQPSNLDKSRVGSSLNKKRIDSSIKQPLDSKHKSVSTVIKSEVKSGPSTPSSSKTITTTKSATVKAREKKVYTLPGQRHDPPEEREPLRIFYESLSEQIPSSEMAEFWLMEHGLLSPERAKKAYERKQRQKGGRLATPVKTPRQPVKVESSHKQQASRNGDVKAKKRIMQESDDDDDDFILSPKRRRG